MLFKKQNCENCNKEYDVALDRCPFCGGTNNSNRYKHVSKKVIWMDWGFQLGHFLIGIAGLEFFSFTVASIIDLIAPSIDGVLFMTLANSIAYGLLFLLQIVFTLPNKNWKKILNSLKNIEGYLFGILFGFALLLSSIVWGYIAQSIHTVSINNNETAVRTMVSEFPVLSIFILCIVGPICEEITYRVGLFGLTSRINRVLAYAVTSLIFGFIHFDFQASDMINELLMIPDYIIAGVILGVAYDFFGLSCSTTAHIINNTTSVLTTIFMRNMQNASEMAIFR